MSIARGERGDAKVRKDLNLARVRNKLRSLRTLAFHYVRGSIDMQVLSDLKRHMRIEDVAIAAAHQCARNMRGTLGL